MPGIVVACSAGAGARHRSMLTTPMTVTTATDRIVGTETYRKPTRRDAFLMEMQALLPWAGLVALIDAHFPMPAVGRRLVPLECMLRILLLQHWFDLVDGACEEALYDSAALLAFVGIDLGEMPVPNAPSILEFRQRMEISGLRHAVLAEVEQILLQQGLHVRAGKIVNAAVLQVRHQP